MQIPETDIIVSEGGVELLRKTVRPGDYVIGREPECELQVEVELVSRRHAQLTVNFDHVLIEDLGSSNGTFVNGKPVTEPTRLWPNQKIQVGAATIELRRVKATLSPDVSLAPQTAAVQRLLPEEFLHEKKYDIGGVVAQGGMGAILDARETTTERTVAMKVMLDGSSPDDLSRFVAEAKVTAQLEHPNIVPVHELGVDENEQVYYTMKFVKGITLRKVLEEMEAGNAEMLRDYPLPALLTIFQKTCDAMAFAHSKGIIHRDLKPENIMLGDFGEALVMDWGLAKRMKDEGGRMKGGEPSAVRDEDGTAGSVQNASSFIPHPSSFASSTLAGSIMGTPQYMSPEQARGEAGNLDVRADVYSLGAILYYILALRPSVAGDEAYAVVEKVARGEIDPLDSPRRHEDTKGEKSSSSFASSRLRGHLPGGRIPDSLAAVVRKAMAFDREARYRRVEELQADIAAYQNGFATSAENAGAWKQFTLLVKRNKAASLGVAAVLLVGSVLGTKAILEGKRAERGEAEAKAEAQRAVKAEGEAVEKGEAARQALAKSALALAEAARRESNGPEMQAALGAVPEDLRDSTWHYLLDQSDSSIARIRNGDDEAMAVAADPRRPGVFALGYDTGKVILQDVHTGVHLLEFSATSVSKSGSGHFGIAFSPDGERIAVVRDHGNRLAIYSARDGKQLLEWEVPGGRRQQFSPDGRLLLQAEGNSPVLYVWDAATGQLRWKYEPEGGVGVPEGVFTPDSQQVVTYSYRDHYRLVSAQDGALVRPLSTDTRSTFALRPDGKMLVIGGGGDIKGVMLADGNVAFNFRAFEHVDFRSIAFTPDGGRFVSTATMPDGRQAIKIWDANTGAALQSLLGGSGDIQDVGVHPLSGELVVAGPNSRVWNLTGTPEKWLGRGNYSGIAFWGSDDVFFAEGGGQQATLQKLQGSTSQVLWKPPESHYNRASVSADGRCAAIGCMTNDSGPHDLYLLRNPGAPTEQAVSLKQPHGLNRLRLSPAGDRLAAIWKYNSGVSLYDTATGQEPVRLEGKDIESCWDLGWLSGGRQLVGLVTVKARRGNPGSEEWVVLWDAATGRIVQTAVNRTAMTALAVAPDGRRFAEAGVDKMVRIRDAATLAVQQEFRAHDGPITTLAWHPTRPIVASASADLSVKIWNIETGRRLEELHGPLIAPTELAFSPSGHRLGCAGPGRIWEPPALNEQSAAAKSADGWEDLLAPLTPATVLQTGDGWRLENGALFSPDKRLATLPLPGNNWNGSSYQVRVKLRQLAAKNVFRIALPVADRMVGFELDGYGGKYTGLNTVNGKAGKGLPGVVEGKQVKDTEQHDLEVTVRLYGTKATITTTLDGQPLYEWAGLTSALSSNPDWKNPPGAFALGTIAADWVVYEVKVKRLEK